MYVYHCVRNAADESGAAGANRSHSAAAAGSGLPESYTDPNFMVDSEWFGR